MTAPILLCISFLWVTLPLTISYFFFKKKYLK
jgi:hypothetical protein